MQLSLEWIALLISVLTLLLSVLCVAVGAFQAYTAISMKLEVANMRSEVATQLSNMRTETQSYMNGSFMRSKEVEAHFQSYDHQLAAIAGGVVHARCPHATHKEAAKQS